MSYEIIAAEKRPLTFDGVDPEHPASRMRTETADATASSEALPLDPMREIFKWSTCATRENLCATNKVDYLSLCETDEHVDKCRAPREQIEKFRAMAEEDQRGDVGALFALAGLENVADEHFEALFDIARARLIPYARQNDFTKNLGVFGDELPEKLFQEHIVGPALKEETDEEDRAAAIEALGSFGERGIEYAGEVMKALYSDKEKVQNAAVAALRKMLPRVDDTIKEELQKANEAAWATFRDTKHWHDHAIASAFDTALAPQNPDE